MEYLTLDILEGGVFRKSYGIWDTIQQNLAFVVLICYIITFMYYYIKTHFVNSLYNRLLDLIDFLFKCFNIKAFL